MDKKKANETRVNSLGLLYTIPAKYLVAKKDEDEIEMVTVKNVYPKEEKDRAVLSYPLKYAQKLVRGQFVAYRGKCFLELVGDSKDKYQIKDGELTKLRAKPNQGHNKKSQE